MRQQVHPITKGWKGEQNSLTDDYRALKTLFNDKNLDMAIVEKSLNEFASVYGENTAEVAEFRALLNRRKNAEIKTAQTEDSIKSRSDEIKKLIQDPEKSLEYLESILSEFIASYGEERKELPGLQRLLEERKRREERSALHEETIVREAKSLIARINDDQEDLRLLQSAVSEFIVQYGEDRKEVPELRRILEERRKKVKKEASNEQTIAEDAKMLASLINNEDENLDKIESALNEFIILYGEERKEILELRQLINERKEKEHFELTIAQDANKIMNQIRDPGYTLRKLEESISDFIKKYGGDRDESLEMDRLLSKRKEKEKREKAIANDIAILKSKILDNKYPIEELEKALFDFITQYGENRKEVLELQDQLKARKEADLKAKISTEAKDLISQMNDRTNTIDFLQSALDQFINDYGDDRAGVQELRRLLDDRRGEKAITDLLQALDTSILEGDIETINTVIQDKGYAEKLIALTEWSGLVF